MKRLTQVMLLTLVSALAACSQDSAPVNQINPPPIPSDDGNTIEYKGPNASSADVLRYQINVWSNLALDDRCGACHIEGGQSPAFARRDSIDEAYNAALTLVDLEAPATSRLVTKVAEGHNCWRAEASVCADTMTTWLENWASSAGVTGKVIVLTPPEVKQAGSSLPFPEEADDFERLVYTPYLRQYCAECHAPDGQTPQQPYFAASDVDDAYEAVKSKINLSAPARSRLVVRLSEESHNCWATPPSEVVNCTQSAAAMESAIAAMAADIEPATIDINLVVSNAVQLAADGIVANSGGRVEPNIIAKYEFKTGQGGVAFDTSGQDPALDLQLRGDVDWLEGGVWGLRFTGGRAQGTTAASAKLAELIRFTGEYSVEAWVAPGNVTQDNSARIVSYSGGPTSRNVTLGQTLYNYDFYNRTTLTDANAMPMLATPNADEVLQATLQHVVVTYGILDGRKIYVNGELIIEDDPDAIGDASLANWNETFALVLGAETDNNDEWTGTIRFLGIHNRMLDGDSVKANFDVGVGEKFYLLFRVTDNLNEGDIPAGSDAYVVFQVEPFDSYSYLFASPFFYILDTSGNASTPPMPLRPITLAGMRIGVNGQESTVGQAFAPLNTVISADSYQAGVGQPLANIGALFPVELGKEADEFFLTFDELGSRSYNRPADPVPEPSTPQDTPSEARKSVIGVKTFAEINAGFSQMTGVHVAQSTVAATFANVQQQLPTDENIEGFLPAHHMGITQLAVAYCSAFVNDSTLFSQRIPGVNLTVAPAVALDSNGRNALIDYFANVVVLQSADSTPLASGPSRAEFAGFINQLIDEVADCGASCSATDTQNTVIAACAAALGSAAMLIH